MTMIAVVAVGALFMLGCIAVTSVEPPDTICHVGKSGDCYIKLDNPKNCYFWSGSFWSKNEVETINWSAACDEGLAQGTGKLNGENWVSMVQQAKGSIEKGRLQGHWVLSDKDETNLQQGPFQNGKKDGMWTHQHKGTTIWKGIYQKGALSFVYPYQPDEDSKSNIIASLITGGCVIIAAIITAKATRRKW